MTEFVDYYTLLGVGTDATDAEVRKAFMRLAKQHHPDAGGTLEHMLQLNTAYTTLKEPQARRAYDLVHSFQTGTSTVQYREVGESADGSSLDGLSDEEIDDFMNTIFAEYATKATKAKIHKRSLKPLKFTRRKSHKN